MRDLHFPVNILIIRKGKLNNMIFYSAPTCGYPFANSSQSGAYAKIKFIIVQTFDWARHADNHVDVHMEKLDWEKNATADIRTLWSRSLGFVLLYDPDRARDRAWKSYWS
jgi:hypothetical protein